MAGSNLEYWQIIQQMRDKKKLRGGQQKLIPIRELCEGTISRFQRQLVPETHDWKSPCPHLAPGPVCGLLEKRAFSELCNPEDARCTVPELILYCDWFLEDNLGSYFKSKSQIRGSGGNLTDQVQSEKSPKSCVEETLLMVPDYKTVLGDLLSSTSHWQWENSPNNWSQHIKIQAHKYIRKFVTKQIPCGNCFHYGHVLKYCVKMNRRKWSESRGCLQFTPIPPKISHMSRPGELTEINVKIIERAEDLLAREATKAHGENPRHADQLERLHSMLLYWDDKDFDEEESLGQLARLFGVSEKTISRDKKEMVRLLQILKETDFVLKELFDIRQQQLVRPSEVLEELEEEDEE